MNFGSDQLKWMAALENSPLVPARNQGVIAAWNYVCRRTQQSFDLSDPSNVARSVYWPECQGDFIYGYGPQTEPNRNPNDPSQQDDLLERDEDAYAPDP